MSSSWTVRFSSPNTIGLPTSANGLAAAPDTTGNLSSGQTQSVEDVNRRCSLCDAQWHFLPGQCTGHHNGIEVGVQLAGSGH